MPQQREDTVTILDPSGNPRMVPQSHADALLQAGGQLATKVVDPQGTPRWIPNDQVSAIRQGGGVSGVSDIPLTRGVPANQMQESPTPMSWMENETNQGLQSGSLPLAVGAGFGGAANESARAAEGVVDPSMLQRFQQNYPKLYDASVDLAKFGAKAAITGGLGYAGIKSGVLPDVVKTLAKAAVTAAGD